MSIASSPFATLAQFLTGYLVILLTPGPNLLAVAGIAALRGLRAALPFCFGIALGAGSLCTAIGLTAGMGGAGLDSAQARLLGAALLGWVACSVARGRVAPVAGAHAAGGLALDTAAGLGAGFATAAINPLTAAYFLSAFLGVAGSPPSYSAAAASVVATALGVFLLVAGVLSQPPVRRAALRWDREIRLVAATMLTLMAFRTIWPLL